MKGKKVGRPIREGTPAKVYLAAFFKPITGYEIAREIFGTREVRREGWHKELTEEVVTPNKPYTIVKKYKELFDRIEKKEGKRKVRKIQSKINPLLDEIDLELEKGGETKLTNQEREILEAFFNSKFRKYVAENFKVDYKQNIDAFAWLTGHMGFPMLFAWIVQNEKNPIGFLEEVRKFSEETFPLDSETFKAILEMPPELRWKIIRSSSGGEAMGDFIIPLFRIISKNKKIFPNLPPALRNI